jgi:cytidyltransferase-like protein
MIIDYKKLNSLEKEDIIFTIGTFDLLHNGHIFFLENVKNISKKSKILVGIISDEITKRLKGKSRPIIKQIGRAKLVDSLKIVDYTFICPPIPTEEIVKKVIKDINPKFSAVTKSSWKNKYKPETTKLIIIKKELKNLSTSRIIHKIKGDKNE